MGKSMGIIGCIRTLVASHNVTIFGNFIIAQCKCVHIFIGQFAIFRVFQEVDGS